MSKTADQYPVSFPYGATDAPYSRANPHKGVDLATPTGTPIVINGVTIGLTGNTGLSTGPHLHIQAGTDKYAQNHINPQNYKFKGDKVVEKGEASQWGKYVIITYKGKYIVYAHLSKILVKAGDTLDGDSMYKEKWEKEKAAHAKTKATLAEARRKMNNALADAKKWKAAFQDAKKKLDKVRGEKGTLTRWIRNAKNALIGK